MFAKLIYSVRGCVVITILCGSPVVANDFSAATRPADTPTPQKSINGKLMRDFKPAVEASWNKIQFENNDKPVNYTATLTTDAGTIKLKFWPDVAPNHCRSFIGLCQAGFYDGLIFHRCIPGFVIQGGCPKGDGSGGPGYCLKPEFNPRPHVAGVLSMARSSRPDSAGSQFFLCDGDADFLDNKYTAFGEVVEGMDVVKFIVNAQRDKNDRPLKPVTIQKATITVD
ncbi:MAG: peptidylprolyl isomerase [Planctomycetota bacterium]|nr:peptidylprolyl isomerase [Planctomycetota bacterium]MDA1177846.1 peptidylprolyl isomerase [Planctomycetota bacterium]